jgi:hypothetical protein
MVYALICAINCLTLLRTASSVYSNCAATRLASSRSAIVRGLEVGAAVGNGGKASQIGES